MADSADRADRANVVFTQTRGLLIILQDKTKRL